MDYLTAIAATLISLTVWSLIIMIYTPTAAILGLAIVGLFAPGVIATRQRRETRRVLRRRLGLPTSTRGYE